MPKKLRISQLHRLKKARVSGPFLRFLLTILAIALFPLVLVGGAIFALYLLVYSLLVNGFSGRSTKKAERLEAARNVWDLWLQKNEHRIQRRWQDEIRFGPSYYELKSEPSILGIGEGFYGDWFYETPRGYLLQRWNTVFSPNAQLVFLNMEEGYLDVIQDNIPSVLWTMVIGDNGEMELNCDTGEEVLVFTLARS